MLIAKGGLGILAANFGAIAGTIGLLITGGAILKIASLVKDFVGNVINQVTNNIPFIGGGDGPPATSDSPGGEAGNTGFGFNLNDLNPFSGLFGGTEMTHQIWVDKVVQILKHKHQQLKTWKVYERSCWTWRFPYW